MNVKRRSQEERSTETRARLCAATIALIAERGYVNTTTTDISTRAGVSRGALMHHYPSKIDLIVDAASGVWLSAIDEVRELSLALNAGDLDTDAFVDGVWNQVFRENSTMMTMDLVSAARSDKELHCRISVHLQNMFEAYDQIADTAFSKTGLPPEQRRIIVSLTTSAIRGLKVQELMHPDQQKTEAAREALKMMLKRLLESEETIGQLPGSYGDTKRAARS